MPDILFDRIDPFLNSAKYTEFNPVPRLHKSISIIRAKPIRSSLERKKPRVFSRRIAVSRSTLPDIWKGGEFPLWRDAEGAPSSRRGVSVYVIKESQERIGGRGWFQTHTYTPISRNTNTRRPRYARSAAVYRYYSGLNNIMSRGKREDLCNWTRERTRSAGSAEETLLPLSIPPQILSPTASFLLIIRYILSVDNDYIRVSPNTFRQFKFLESLMYVDLNMTSFQL